ncbi:ABC transporter substrate-binding protein [Conexibacter sp. JD483]|uniref:ABC transporter substrate-binding protein n=1 Tax=unclassified Conexibacter TaxID=2627773 RepID=UPI002725B353|nr:MULTISPECIES: ABC transporter substrate-binding protein [unclassified Conexibacter]MDO8189354.1 ABC transporter substrate-binding protein [Conexibacter sp. CPCC 205706]MDO8200274.1 ABC transporter substrate-binding protein [Conexibacter sp. CPCC 205762]MDR9372755.1 ABC transporter substrate-binding protein [Conexibacter sp. JD483]
MRQKRTSGRLLALAIALIALAATFAACGSSDDDAGSVSTNVRTTDSGQLAEMTRATLVLDFVPNAVHAGIYRALAAGYYRRNNIDLKVIQPTSTADTLRLINADKADFGLADGLDVGNQIERGLDIEAFMAIVQRPLGGVITLAADRIASGRDLEGKTVGVTGVPSDNAVLDTIVDNAGGDPGKVKVVTIGFNGVQNLESGKIAGFTGFWPADGVQVQVDGKPTKDFKLDENGGPAYPGLVAFSTRSHMARDPALIRAFADATIQGYEDTIRDPATSLRDLLAQNKSLREDITRAQLDAYGPLFQGDAASFGTIDPGAVDALSTWMVARRLARRPFTSAEYGGNGYLPAG